MASPLFAFLGPFQWLFAFVGTLIISAVVLKTIYFFGKNVFVFFLAERLGLTVNFRDLGEWAVVTGATDGIGKGYAFDVSLSFFCQVVQSINGLS
jgi:hypothetical protein